MRFFIEISYKGTNYHGWQVQSNASSIQSEINKALSTILNTKIEVTGAGRTDTGVHAKQMFAHFNFSEMFDVNQSISKLNGVLPKDIAIFNIYKVNENANCRFDAISRTYHYHIIHQKNSFKQDAYLIHKKLNVIAMNKACSLLLGQQDFTSFSKVNTQTFTNNCNVMLAKWEQKEDELIFTIKADRFLRNMVRAIVGTLLDVGMGKISSNDVKKIISQKDRSKAGTSVPAHALFLSKVEYPKHTFNG
jgi:tRNA pseudouridine38-40 synthase